MVQRRPAHVHQDDLRVDNESVRRVQRHLRAVEVECHAAAAIHHAERPVCALQLWILRDGECSLAVRSISTVADERSLLQVAEFVEVVQRR